MTRSFKELILEDLFNGKKLTTLNALQRHGSWALRSRISDLKNKDRVPIRREIIELKSGKHIAQYSL